MDSLSHQAYPVEPFLKMLFGEYDANLSDVEVANVVSLKRLNNRVTRVIPAKAGIQKVCTVDSVSSTEWHIVWLLR